MLKQDCGFVYIRSRRICVGFEIETQNWFVQKMFENKFKKIIKNTGSQRLVLFLKISYGFEIVFSRVFLLSATERKKIGKKRACLCDSWLVPAINWF